VEKGHPLVTSTWWRTFPTALYARGATCAALGLLYGTTTWMRADEDASCVAIVERTGGNAL
jgi:hypothetical protein